MIETGFIAAIDLGASKITGVVGRINENDVISVLALHTIPSENAIRRGLVYNIEETGAKVKKLISLLENQLGKKIGRAYVSVAGQSLHNVMHKETKQLSSSGIVTDNVVEQMYKEAEKFKPEMSKRYAIADVEYFLDNQPETKPVGVSCSRVEAHYQMIVGRPNITSNIEKSIKQKTEIDIAGYTVGPLASAAIALTDEDKELGCAFIDFGGGTTTLSIYKNGLLRKLVVIPFGGKHITKDIAALNFTETIAENLKIKFGKVGKKNTKNLFTQSEQSDVDLVELNKVIELRLEEIVANLKEQIKQSGYADELAAGIIITGGASLLKGLDDYLNEKLKMPVKFVSAKKSMINNASELANNPAYTQALGLLLFGDIDCEKIIVQEEPKEDDTNDVSQTKEKKEKTRKIRKKSGAGFFSKMGDMLGDMFAEGEE